MKIDKVVLVNTQNHAGPPREVVPATENTGLMAIKSALEFAGYDPDSIGLFPSRKMDLLDSNIEMRKKAIKNELEKAVGDAKAPIFGISTYTDHYFKSEIMSDVIRAYFPRSPIIAGGPHFRRESLVDKAGRKVRDSVELALEERIADGVVVGNASPFVDLLTSRKKDICDGLYILGKDGKIDGRGIGKMPSLKELPYRVGKDLAHIMLKSGCSNGCDFCCANGNHFLADDKLVVESLVNAASKLRNRHISIVDSNPFEKGSIEYYDRILSKADSHFESPVPKSVYLEPSLLVEKSYRKRLSDFFRAHNIRVFFFGRDAVDGRSANDIGSRVKGVLKTQSDLDREKKGLLAFIDWLKNADYPHPSRSFEVELSYIVSPFVNKKSASKLVDEMRMFESLSSSDVEVVTQFSPLTPYPGTKVKRKYLDLIVSPENFVLQSTQANPWSYSIGKGPYFIDAMLDIYFSHVSGKISRENYFSQMQDAVSSSFAKTIAKKSDEDKRRLV